MYKTQHHPTASNTVQDASPKQQARQKPSQIISRQDSHRHSKTYHFTQPCTSEEEQKLTYFLPPECRHKSLPTQSLKYSTGTKTIIKFFILNRGLLGFLGYSVVKNPPANTGGMSLIPDPGRSHMLWGN